MRKLQFENPVRASSFLRNPTRNPTDRDKTWLNNYKLLLVSDGCLYPARVKPSSIHPKHVKTCC